MVTVEAKLFVVGTPIGNLGDWTDRAREVISQVRWVAVQDTGRPIAIRGIGCLDVRRWDAAGL